jgi:phosphoserine phosphatase
MQRRAFLRVLALSAATLAAAPSLAQAKDPLPSWNAGPSKQAILAFVKKVTARGGAGYVAPADRIAALDNDGTLWEEQPNYPQVLFMVERAKELAPTHPDWKHTQPFQAILEGDEARLAQLSHDERLQLQYATQTGMTEGEFEQAATAFLSSYRHARHHRLLTELVYQPMLELIRYLEKNDFKVFICSGGGTDFIRTFSERVYGIPRERVVGTVTQTRFELRDNQPTLMRLPEIVLPFNEYGGKPVGLQRAVGRPPILAFGNSDGDIEMLEFTESPKRPWLALLLNHDDEEREYAYTSRAEKSLQVAKERGWTVVSMKRDFKTIFPPERH